MTTRFHHSATDDFVSLLKRSQLLERGDLEEVLTAIRQRYPHLPEPPVLADFLVKRRVLTPYQADRLLRGSFENLVLDHYVLIEQQGSGSLGPVFLAQSRKEPGRFAVQLLPRRSMWNVRLAKRYARTFEQVEHPVVVPFRDVGTAGGTHYLVWPVVEGETLSTLIEREGKLAPGLAAWYGVQMAEGLACCHGQRVVHGLLTPGCVIIGPDRQVRITDFGLGAILAQTRDDEESMIHTQGQVNLWTSGIDCGSPESIQDPADRTPAGDQYSLGCLLYCCLTGRFPFEGSLGQKMVAHRSQPPASARTFCPEVPEALAAIVGRLLGKAPHDRYEDCSLVAEALREYAEPPAALAEPVDPSTEVVNVLRPTFDELHLDQHMAPRPLPHQPINDASPAKDLPKLGRMGLFGLLLALLALSFLVGLLLGK